MSSYNRVPFPFIVFCQEKREAVSEANPSASFGDISILLAESWKALSDAERHAYANPDLTLSRSRSDVYKTAPVMRRSNRLRNKRLGHKL